MILSELEDIYRPYKPKKRTRATIAKEKGLEPLSMIIYLQQEKKNIYDVAKEYIDSEKGVETVEDAINGAGDIIAENIADDAFNNCSKLTNITFSKKNKALEKNVFSLLYNAILIKIVKKIS